MNRSNLLFAGTLIAIAAITRFLPHPPNFTAIGAMALFGAATISNKKLALVIPILAMLISDLFIPGGFNPSVYASFAGIVLIGFLLRNKIGVLSVGLASLSASVLFFLVTNLPVWYSGYYTNDINGMIASYTAAIPFFHYTALGDLFFSAVFFGAYSYATRLNPAIAK